MNPLKQIICAGMVAALMPAFAAETPNSAEQLLNRLQSAIKAKDTNALVALVNCQGISDRMKSLILPMMADMPNHEIASMKLIPLPEKYQSTYEVNGIRYRPNVPPVGLIDVQFVKSENAVQSMQVPYGKSSDGFWIPGTLEEKITGAGSTEALGLNFGDKIFPTSSSCSRVFPSNVSSVGTYSPVCAAVRDTSIRARPTS